MSSSNAAAIRRRAGINNTPDTLNQNTKPTKTVTSSNNSGQMNLQQVFSTIDKRLIQLEGIAKNNNQTENTNNNELPEIVSEFNERFELLVTEINSMKDVMLKLQTYTMDVNKMLLDERINILSDIDNKSSTDNLESITHNIKEVVENEING